MSCHERTPPDPRRRQPPAGRRVAAFAAAALFVLPLARAAEEATPVIQTADGALVGLVSDPTGTPIARALVTARRTDAPGIRATLSNNEGLYSFADLPAGTWSVSASLNGPAGGGSPALRVVAGEALRFDLVMNAPAGAPALAARPGTAPPAPAAPAASGATLAAAAPAATPAANIPLALQAPPAGPEVDNETPFAYADFTWLNGSPRTHAPIFDTNFFTPELRMDVNYLQSLNHPQDHTIVGSTEEFRSGEFQIEQIGFGGDFHWENVKARLMMLFGDFAVTTPRNDASPGVGQWDLVGAYKYVSEANAGYHFDVNHGLNVDAGIFVSYIGLFSYYNFDNWAYQPSYVSSNTPWFFNGLRVQWFPTNKLKIEPWLINGWQSYAKYNSHPGFGGQILWLPSERLKLVFNNYGIGQDNLANNQVNTPGNPLAKTSRVHTDDSIEMKVYDDPGARWVTKSALSFTVDAGCQEGGGVHCTGGPNRSSFLGWMLYDRYWFDHNRMALTLGGGAMNNPGRYLTLLPPINGATAITGSPYFTENPGQGAYMWDTNLNFQYMPKEWITWWAEIGYRHSNIPYFAGPGGVTPPGGNNGSPQYFSCNSGASAGTSDPNQAINACAAQGGVWYPDLTTHQTTLGAGILVKF